MLKQLLLATTLALGALAPVNAQGLSQSPANDSAALFEAAKKESGLLVYSNLALNHWGPITTGFATKYPGVKLEVIDLGAEVFARYYAESATSGRTADVIFAGGEDNWHEFQDKKFLMNYASPEAPAFADWTKPYPGLYTLLGDPVAIIYNKRILPEKDAPKSVHGLVDLLKKRPELSKRIGTQGPYGSFGRGVQWMWFHHNADGWDILKQLAPATRAERTAGPMLEKVTTGEYALSYFVSGASLFSKLKEPAFKALVGWSFIEDGTPIVPRRIGIPAKAANPNSAKLLLNYMLSREGQIALGQNGATIVRDDVSPKDVPYYTLGSVIEAVGGANRLAIDVYDKAYATEREPFLKQLQDLYGQ